MNRTVKFTYEKQLKALKVFDKFLKNYIDARMAFMEEHNVSLDTMITYHNQLTTSFRQMLLAAFNWANSPEGVLFWKLVSITDVSSIISNEFYATPQEVAEMKISLN